MESENKSEEKHGSHQTRQLSTPELLLHVQR